VRCLRLAARAFSLAPKLTPLGPRVSLLLVVAWGTANGQGQSARHELRVEAGVAQIEQPGVRARSAFVLGALRHHADSTLAGLIAANLTAARDSVAAVQFLAAGAWRPAPASIWQVEGGASFSAFQLISPSADGNAGGWLRVRRQTNSWLGVYAGAAAGHTIRGSSTGHSNSLDLGAWAMKGAFSFDLAASRVRTEDSLLMAASQVYTTQRSAWIDMQDLALTASWARGQLDLSATQRWRLGVLGTSTRQSGLVGAATYAFTPRISLVTSAGRHLADPLRGAPEATVMTAMLRLSFAEVSDAAPPSRESEVTIARMTDGSVLIVRVNAGAMARVEIAGSFSGFEPVPITFRGGFWEAQVRVSSGRHRVAYRIDGGAWRAPAGLAKLREFDGEVGLIVVP
jgi:hypothetical protein